MNLAQVLDEEILPVVEKPSRYLGNEVNAVHKSLDGVEVRLAITFPDLYDLGLGNLGIHILYAAVNALPWARCERVYAPGVDMERELRERGLPLFALESKDSLDQFDGIGISLQSELTYTNILNILDLAGMPLRTQDRDDTHPITFAGGPAVFNPEPLAPFIDCFVIGDGEDAIIEITEVLRKLRGRSRKAKLLALSALEGVYVPEFYPFETLPSGAVVPALDAPKIRKRVVKDMNGATFPTDYIVPYTKQVHDRISLEVLRGCTQGCRFCMAGMVTRPVRERKLEKVDELMRRTLDNTGYEEVSLVSLSTCDYSRVSQLVENAVETARPQRVSVSLPSLRLDSFSVELSDMVAEQRKSGITFAPEAATPRMRSVINKFIPDEELLDMSSQVFARGWDTVKLYFMIGLPTEREEDIEAIGQLAIRTLQAGREQNRRARVNLGVSTFVPKPFTPFQWARQIDVRETLEKQDLLEGVLRPHRSIKFGRHEPEETYLEGLVSRADRRAADLIEAAFHKGCRFEAWSEHLRFDLWMEAVHEVGYDAEDAMRERSVDERLPWDHIDILVDKDWLVEDWERAKQLQWAPDCRQRKCHKCGVIDEERELCATMLRTSIAGRKDEAAWERKPVPEFVEPDPVQKLWFRIARVDASRFLSHLEVNNVWIRALRRAKAPLAYSQGFHPHPKVAYSTALPVGEETTGDYMEVTLHERVDPPALMQALRDTLPAGFDVLGVTEVPLNAGALMGLAKGAEYTVFLPHESADHVEERVRDLLARDEILVGRTAKVRSKKNRGRGRRREKVAVDVNVRPMIKDLRVREGDVPAVDITLVEVDGKPGKAREIVELLTAAPHRARVLKRDTLLDRKGEIRSVSEDWGTPASAK